MYHALVLTLAIQDTDSLGTVFSWSTDPDNHAICLTYQNIDVPYPIPLDPCSLGCCQKSEFELE